MELDDCRLKKGKEMLVAFALVTDSWEQFEERFLEDFQLGASLAKQWLTYTDSCTDVPKSRMCDSGRVCKIR